jgi:hypothetical protein
MRMVDSVLSSAVEDLQQRGGAFSSSSHHYQQSSERDSLLEAGGGGGEQQQQQQQQQQLLSISDVLKSAPSLALALDDSSRRTATAAAGSSIGAADTTAAAAVELRPSASASSPSHDQAVLHFATTAMVHKIEIIEDAASRGSAVSARLDVKLVPKKFQVFAGLFGFFYCGLFYSYSGWVTSYASGTGIASSSTEASYLTSQFFLWATVGSLLSVPMSVLFSTSFLLRVQLAFVVLGAFILVITGSSCRLLNLATATLGFGTSCVFPLLICLANDYKFTMYVN